MSNPVMPVKEVNRRVPAVTPPGLVSRLQGLQVHEGRLTRLFAEEIAGEGGRRVVSAITLPFGSTVYGGIGPALLTASPRPLTTGTDPTGPRLEDGRLRGLRRCTGTRFSPRPAGIRHGDG